MQVSGPIRLLVVLSVAWVAIASFLYWGGVGREFNVYSNDFLRSLKSPPVPMSQQEVDRLPSLSELEKRGSTLNRDHFSALERSWASVTFFKLPMMYVYDEDCDDIFVRNELNTRDPMLFTTTCRLTASPAGYLAFVGMPLALLLLLFGSAAWILRGRWQQLKRS